jgi:hypothetical protein
MQAHFTSLDGPVVLEERPDFVFDDQRQRIVETLDSKCC